HGGRGFFRRQRKSTGIFHQERCASAQGAGDSAARCPRKRLLMSLTDAQDAVAFYGRDVEEFAQRYDAVAFEAVHAGLIDLLPPRGAAVLDIGAGSGRDARALAAMGFKVTAVEPSEAFRERSSQDRSIVWIDDR